MFVHPIADADTAAASCPRSRESGAGIWNPGTRNPAGRRRRPETGRLSGIRRLSEKERVIGWGFLFKSSVFLQ